MAKKGTKHRSYNYEFKISAVEGYFSGKYGGRIQLAKKLGIPEGTLNNWLRKYRKDPELLREDNRGNKGQPKKVDFESMRKDEQIEHLKIEVEVLKKLKALRRNKGEL